VIGSAAPRLDIAVIGCGAAAEGLYLNALRKLESRGLARVTALVDPNPLRTAALGRSFRSARAFADPVDAFASKAPDLTIVASPPGLHARHTLDALAAGVHVLCEKPMAIGLSEAERMVAAASLARRVLAIGMTRRMYPCLVEAQALIAQGAIGDRPRFVYREGHVYEWPVGSDAAFRRATAGGGVLMDIGSHVLDFLSALFGAPATTTYADDAHADGVETNCRLEVMCPHASGEVQLSWNQPLVTGLRICGSAGELVLDPERIDSIRFRRHDGAWETRVSTATWPADLDQQGRRGTPQTHRDCVYYQLVQVMRAVVHGEDVPVSGEEGLAVIRAIDSCYERATSLRLPWLDAAEQSQADAHHWRGRRCAAA
jgi:predicted dehydrogenase